MTEPKEDAFVAKTLYSSISTGTDMKTYKGMQSEIFVPITPPPVWTPVTKEIKDKNLDLDNISDEMTDKLFNAYVGLAETTTNYMLIKSVVPSTTRGEKRLAFAKNLQKFADNTLEKLGVTFRKEEETIQEEKMHVKETEEMELGIDM